MDPYFVTYTSIALGLPVLVWFVVANFKVRIEQLSWAFKILAISLLLAALVRMIIPPLAVFIQKVEIIQYSGLSNIFTSIAFFLIFGRLLIAINNEKYSTNMKEA